jgi:hypothetical protein
MKDLFRDAYIWFPCFMILKDIAATVVVLSNEPGISEPNARHYHIALLPGGLLFGGAGWAWLFNLCVAVVMGSVVSRRSK